MKPHAALLSLFFSVAVGLQAAPDLQPLMAVPDQKVLHQDFSVAGPLDKTQWSPRQRTRWEIKDGVLLGIPSTQDYQDSRKDHKGLEPRLSCPTTPAQFIAKFSVKFSGGAETAIVPFVEFGHHVCRLRFSKEGLEMLVDHESTCVAAARDVRFESGRWYHFVVELKAEEILVQIADGPTLYAQHPYLAKPTPSGGNGLGFAGPKDGQVEIDDVTLWTIKPEAQPTWPTQRKSLPTTPHSPVGSKKKGQ